MPSFRARALTTGAVSMEMTIASTPASLSLRSPSPSPRQQRTARRLAVHPHVLSVNTPSKSKTTRRIDASVSGAARLSQLHARPARRAPPERRA